MLSLPIGAILTVIIFVMSMGIQNIPIYFNFHSAVLVGGGTIAVLLFATPMPVLMNLKDQIKNLFAKTKDLENVQAELVQLAKNRTKQITSAEALIVYAQDLWMQGVEHELFIVLISQKRKELEQQSVDAIQSLKNLAKYPPALGMAGTVMGIVELFKTMENGKEQIGPALAMALTATFFGLMIANAIVMPISDRLQVRLLSYSQYLNHVYEVLLLINQEESEVLIEDEVKLRATA